MPKFDQVPLRDAMVSSATGKRARIIREYQSYIEQLKSGNAGRLQAAEGETLAAVRRRLGAAARGTGTQLVFRRKGDALYFWAKRRRGRPRKIPGA